MNTQKDKKMEPKDLILNILRKAGKPLNIGQISEETGLSPWAVDRAMIALKAASEIVSPRRCYWAPSYT